MNAAWEANAFHTMRAYQVNAFRFKGFSPVEILLDNQAEISIMRPELLRLLRPVDEHLLANGIGGVQITR